jgi:hypothetical protein
MSVALFTNNPGTQTLNNMGYIGGMPGTQGGGWPATIWNAFMTQVYGNTPAYPGGIFQQQQSQNGFATWQQAQPGQQDCTQQQWLQGLGQGQTPQCTCPKHAHWCNTQNGNNPPGPGNGNGNPTPSPSQTCQLPAPLCPTPTTGTTAAFVYGTSPASGSLPPLGWSVLLAAEEAAVTRPTAVT